MLTCDYSGQIAGDVKVWKGGKENKWHRRPSYLWSISEQTHNKHGVYLFQIVFLNLSLNILFPCLCLLRWNSFNPLQPESNQHLISPYSNNAESFNTIMKIKEMFAKPKALIVKQILLVKTKRNV